jgi:hypothetical protein
MMPKGLASALAVTDVLMLLYWTVTALAAVRLLNLPPEALYKGYHQPVLVAWNWSFLPLDLAFSLTGLAAVGNARRGRPWRGLAIISLTLTMCAGAMAIGFWTLRSDFDPGWWLPNLVLAIGPLLWLPQLVREAS